jgi:hypothetical protein
MFMKSRSQVPDTQRRGQQKPKRRSSCDACGAAKLRCDRGQPSCERCINQILQCVYGVCRKMGKPPQRSVNPHSNGEARGSNNGPASNRRASTHDINATTSVTLPPSMDTFTSNDFSGNALGLASDLSALDHLFKAPLSPSWQNFLSAEFGADGVSPNLGSGMMDGPSLDMQDFTTSRTSTDGEWSDDSSAQASGTFTTNCAQEHNCTKNAHAILRSLSYETGGEVALPPPDGSSSPAAPLTTPSVPFAQMLEVNRTASKCLKALLMCPCASSPGLALMYSSILFNILEQYGRAASSIDYNQSHPINPLIAPAVQGGTHGVSQSSGNASQVKGIGESGIGSARSAPFFAPSQIWIGSFSIEDSPTQAALSIQVLHDEVRQIEPLVNLLAASGRGNVDRSTSDNNAQDMGESLQGWVRKEHTKTVSLVRRRLAHLLGSLNQDMEHGTS